MKTTRFLLPFVYGVDKFAVEQAILLTKSHHATLIPLVLINMPAEHRKKGVRLEYLQQSMDFLETVKQKADWYAVQIEKLEVFTSDVLQSIHLVASEMECEGILLFVGYKGGILLNTQQIKGLMESPMCKFYLTRLPTEAPKGYTRALRLLFSRWLSGRNMKREDRTQEQEYIENEAELSMNV